jgi:hypothetical protein
LTVGALLSDSFARYGADLLRFLIISLVASGLSWLTAFVAPVRSNPFEQPTGFVDVSGLLGLLGFVAGIVGSSTMLALAEGGPEIPFGRAFRRGVERSGWLFLTSLVMGAAFIALFLIALIPIGLFAIISPVLIVVPMVALFAIFLWAGLRLMLALPANVADNLNSIEALKVSWRATRPTGVWGRLFGTSLLLGLLVAPAAFGAMLFALPAILSTMFTGGIQPLALLVPAVVFTILTPFSLLIAFSAYRRLVPPLQPSWTALPTPPIGPIAARCRGPGDVRTDGRAGDSRAGAGIRWPTRRRVSGADVPRPAHGHRREGAARPHRGVRRRRLRGDPVWHRRAGQDHARRHPRHAGRPRLPGLGQPAAERCRRSREHRVRKGGEPGLLHSRWPDPVRRPR